MTQPAKLPHEPKLAKPGAGLPFLEWAVAKYILLPPILKNSDKNKSLESFARSSQKILTTIKKLSIEELNERRLVPRLRGLEDSSRFWSVAMTMQHLCIVGDELRFTVLQLSEGKKISKALRVEDVKPASHVYSEEIIAEFEAMSDRFLNDTRNAEIDEFPDIKHAHPWFGPLNAREWLVFGGIHQNIHLKQIEAIISRF